MEKKLFNYDEAVMEYLVANVRGESHVSKTSNGGRIGVTEISLNVGISVIDTLRSLIKLCRFGAIAIAKTSTGYMFIIRRPAAKSFMNDTWHDWIDSQIIKFIN